MRVLVLNPGSSTLKAAIVENGASTADALIEWPAGERDASGVVGSALEQLPSDLDAVGYRVVHGGTEYRSATRVDEALLVLATVPFAVVGGFWLIWLLGHDVSIATAVGFIALAGVAAEFGVVMLIYLKQAWESRLAAGNAPTLELLDEAIREGAVLRVRPKAMTVAVIIAGLLPIMWGSGTGSEVMQRIAAPMVGGMITAPLLSMFVIPAAYLLMRKPHRSRTVARRAIG